MANYLAERGLKAYWDIFTKSASSFAPSATTYNMCPLKVWSYDETLYAQARAWLYTDNARSIIYFKVQTKDGKAITNSGPLYIDLSQETEAAINQYAEIYPEWPMASHGIVWGHLYDRYVEDDMDIIGESNRCGFTYLCVGSDAISINFRYPEGNPLNDATNFEQLTGFVELPISIVNEGFKYDGVCGHLVGNPDFTFDALDWKMYGNELSVRINGKTPNVSFVGTVAKLQFNLDDHKQTAIFEMIKEKFGNRTGAVDAAAVTYSSNGSINTTEAILGIKIVTDGIEFFTGQNFPFSLKNTDFTFTYDLPLWRNV